jgi:hypothetical protein
MKNKLRWYKIIKSVIAWIILALLGWMAYGTIRGLSAIITLGAPFYDWQWYLVALILVIGPPLYFCYRVLFNKGWPRKEILVPVIAALLTWLIAGFNGFNHIEFLELDQAAPIPISFWSGRDFRNDPDQLLEDLHEAGGRIYYALGAYSAERLRAVIEITRHLADFDINMYWSTPAATPTADDFLSVPVYRAWISNTQQAMAIVRDNSLTKVQGLFGDAEQPAHSPIDLAGSDQVNFFRAVEDMRGLIVNLHHEQPNLAIGMTAGWPSYVDRLDGDADLSIVLRTLVEPPGGWDFVNLMAYTSYLPADWRAYYIYLYERALMRLYPEGQTSFLLGLFGTSSIDYGDGLEFSEMVRDARLSRVLGAKEIVVFHLDSMLQVYGNSIVRKLNDAVNGPAGESIAVPFSRPVSMLFYAQAAVDAFLDLRGSRAVIWLGWFVVCGVLILSRMKKGEHTGSPLL